MQAFALAALVSVFPMALEGQPSKAELLEALGNAAATFSRTAPGLGARESLVQRARVASIDILKGSEKDLRKIEVHLPDTFTSHEVESAWALGSANPLHEVRTIRSIDSVAVPDGLEARHAMTLGPPFADDETQKRLLEDLEQGKLQGAAADFVPMLLLFTQQRQRNYDFIYSGTEKIDGQPMFVLSYRQISGDEAFTEFRDRSQMRRPAKGKVWFRETDLLPLRITLNTTEALSVRDLIRNGAEVNYTPTPFGLAPALVIHQQFLNRDLLVENKFRYSDYTGQTAIP